MARLQILELPSEHHGDDTVTPFVLVIDRVQNSETMLDFLRDPPHLRDELGARTVLVFDEEVEIPANETPVDPDGYPLKIRVEPDFEQFREQVQDEALYAQGKVTRALDGQRLAHERTEIARDMDRLAKRKNELTDALGMDPTRDWDDIRNSARGLRAVHEAEEAALDRVRDLPEQQQRAEGAEYVDVPQGAEHVYEAAYHLGYRNAILDAKQASRSVSVQTPQGLRPGKVVGGRGSGDA